MAYLLQNDAVNGKSGKAFCTIDGRNVELFGLRSLTATEEYITKNFPVVGTKTVQEGITAVQHTGTFTIYYGTPEFVAIARAFNQNGKMPEITLQVTNDDEGTSLGVQTIAYYGVVLKKIPVSMLNDGADYLAEEIPFSYHYFEVLSAFGTPGKLGG